METSTASPETATEVCPQCGNPADWKTSSWCTACGYYPAVGRLIDAPACEGEDVIYENWWEAVPFWLWVLVGGVLTLCVTSIFARVAFAAGLVRFWWTVLQMTAGLAAAVTAHFLAYLHGASRSDKVGPLDALMKPIATWQPVFRSLPEKRNLLWAGGWGLSGFLLAYLVIDGIDYQAMAEARKKAEEKERSNPMAAIISTAQTVAKVQDQLPSASQADSIEDALGDFTGEVVTDENLVGADLESGLEHVGDPQEEGGIDPQDPAAGEEDAESPDANAPGTLGRAKNSPGERIRCVVVGYTTNAAGEPRSLLLAAPDRKGLHFVAKVPLEQVAPEVQRGLQERFVELHQRRPVISSPYGGRWLKPQLFCEVQFSGWTAGGRLNEPFVTQFAMIGEATPSPPKSAAAAP